MLTQLSVHLIGLQLGSDEMLVYNNQFAAQSHQKPQGLSITVSGFLLQECRMGTTEEKYWAWFHQKLRPAARKWQVFIYPIDEVLDAGLCVSALFLKTATE